MKIYINNRIPRLFVVFIFLLFPYLESVAQTPGGVGSTGSGYTWVAWLTPDSYNSGTWTNNVTGTGSVGNFTAPNNAPEKIGTGYNYHPSVNFPINDATTNTNSYRLLSQNGFSIATNDNVTFIFVLKRSTTPDTYDHLLSFSTAYTGNGVISWRGSGSTTLLMEWDGSRRTLADFNEGIATIDNVSKATAGDNMRFYNNGATTATVSTSTTATIVSNQIMTIASGENNGAYYGYDGDIQEIIVLKASGTGNHIDPADLRKIHTYLALKYSITLKNNDNYEAYDTDGTSLLTLWTRDSGYNQYIFGIGRDDASGLYQKQSKSHEEKYGITVYVGDEVMPLNEQNDGTLLNKKFMVLGSNGLASTGSDSYNPGVYNINKKEKYILKAQTNMTTPVKIQLPANMRAEYVMISPTDAFIAANTQFFSVDERGSATLTIPDGWYIGFASHVGSIVGGLAGGVTPELWLAADKINSLELSNEAEVNGWADLSMKGRDFTQNGTDLLPEYAGSTMNFQPGVVFKREIDEDATLGQNNARKLASIQTFLLSNTKAYYTFWVSQITDSVTLNTPGASVFSFGTGTINDVGWTTTKTLRLATAGTNGVYPSATPTYGIGTAIVPNSGTGNRLLYYNGVSSGNITGSSVMGASNTQAVLGNSNTTTGSYFYGNIQEVIVLSVAAGTQLGQTDMDKVNSYLAIKYGQTLGVGDYLNSAGTVIWDRTTNNAAGAGGYTKAIFGLARDDDSGLYQKQSTSQDNRTITVYLDDLKETNKDNNGALATDKSFLMFASNELTGYASTPYVYPAGTGFAGGTSITEAVNNRLNRVLRVQSNISGGQLVSINVHVDAAYLLVSSAPTADDTFAQANTRVYPIVNHSVKNITIKDGDFIGFALYGITPGGAGIVPELWLASDKVESVVPTDGVNITHWNDISPYGRDFVRNGTNPTPTVTYDGMNYQPAIEFDNINGQSTTTKLVSQAPFPLSTGKAYYTFWVSELGTGSNTQATVFSFGTGTSGSTVNDVGWTSGGLLRHATRGTDYSFAGATMPVYGIGTAIQPNDGSTAQQQYHNGLARTTAIEARTMVTANAQNTAILGNAGTGAERYFYGKISEVIVLSASGHAALAPTDRAKIQSYLAIKYGITLSTTGQPDYVRSDGVTKVWTGSQNGGYQNHIFGIGIDPESGLNQKQSTSSSRKVATVFVGDLADLNANNTGSLEPYKFLMLGLNNADDEALHPYNHATLSGTGTFVTGDIDPDEPINYLKDYVLKAQVTNPDGTAGSMTVNVKPHIGANYVLVNTANDPTFPLGTTRAYQVVDGVATGVLINNGELVGFASFEVAPGGVISKLRVWLKADDAGSVIKYGTGTANNVDKWMDQTSKGNDYSFADVTALSKKRPTYLSCDEHMNYYPTIKFGLYEYLARNRPGPMSVASPDNTTSFVVYYNTETSANGRRMYTHGFGSTNLTSASRRPAVGFYPSNETGRMWAGGGGDGIDGVLKGFHQYTTALHMVRIRRAGATGGRLWENDFGGAGEALVRGTSSFGNNFYMNRGSIIGGASLDPASYASHGSFQGLISEVLFYERNLDESERNKLRTYLGIKYGITLDKDQSSRTVNYDYVLSDQTEVAGTGTYVWPGNTASPVNYARFHNNVAGLVRDDAGDLHNNKARSTAAGAIITMSVQGHDECGQGENTLLAHDLSGLFWGHNIKTVENPTSPDTQTTLLTKNKDVCGLFDFVMNRVWLVKKTNLEEQAVTIEIGSEPGSPSSAFFPYASSNYQVFLLVGDKESNFDLQTLTDPNHMWKQMIPCTFIDGQHKVDYTFTEDVTYFALGVKKISNGVCPSCEFGGAKRLSFTTGTNATWVPSTGNNRDRVSTTDLGDGFKVRVETKIDANAYFGSRSSYSATDYTYPRPVGGALQLYRRGRYYSGPNGSGDPLYMTTIITPYEGGAAGASFQLKELDREGSGSSTRYDEVDVWGMCGDAMVTPTLSYVTTPARSSFTIVGNKATAKRTPNPGFDTNTGKMNVDFDYPVEEIVIRQKVRIPINNTTSFQRIGVGPITFTCPQPLPPANEDGLIFAKQATPELLLCETAEIRYTIINTNCSAKTVHLTDTLPEKMKWVSNSMSVKPASQWPADPNLYNGTRYFEQDFTILAADTLIVRMGAIFDTSETEDKVYNTGKATIGYLHTVEGVLTPTILQSCDRLTPGCDSTRIHGLPVTDRPEPVVLGDYKANTGYKENQVINVEIPINNPNSTMTITNANISASFNDEFAYVAGSLKLDGVSLTPVEGSTGVDDAGYIYAEGFSVSAGSHTLTFQLTAPDELHLQYWVDEDDSNIHYDKTGAVTTDPNEWAYRPLEIFFDMGVASGDICMDNTMVNVNGDFYIPYITSLPCIITNKHVTNRLRRK
jgi:hypothetical protein